jgi:hypothetical protein
MHASHEARSPFTHPLLTLAHLGSPWLTLVARCECLKRHGVGEREGDLAKTLIPRKFHLRLAVFDE